MIILFSIFLSAQIAIVAIHKPDPKIQEAPLSYTLEE